jgi:AcrR family transcriptional regulator
MMDLMTSSTRQTRTGGRSALVLAAIKSAVEELVAERGAERVTVPLVAERAGVNHSTIYRRWGDAQTMINDLATYRLDPGRDLPTSGDLRADLTAWAQEIVRHYRDPVRAALLRAGAASAGEQESDCLRDRRAEATALVGSVPAPAGLTSDDVLNHVVAPIIYRVIFLPWTLTDSTAADLVDTLLRNAPTVEPVATAS